MKTSETVIWQKVIGQKRVKETLLSDIASGRLPHAYLFSGSTGTGKDAMAIEFARALHCETGMPEPCGKCTSCRQIELLQHPDVRFVTALPVGKGEKSDDSPILKLQPDDIAAVREELGKKARNPYYQMAIPRANVIKITSIRDARREAAMSTASGKTRFIIISRAEEMEDESANAMLKTLEEPTRKTIIILTTSQRDALLPTIRSRCREIRFDMLAEGDIAAALQQREETPADQAALISRLSHGSYAKALDLLQEDIASQRKDVVEFVRSALGRSIIPVHKHVEMLTTGKDREYPRRFLELLAIWFRDALVLSLGQSTINTDQAADMKRFITNFPEARCAHIIRDIEQAIHLLDRNVYARLIFLKLVIQLRKNIGSPVERRPAGIIETAA